MGFERCVICAAHTLGFRNHRGLSLAERCSAARSGGFSSIGWTLEDWHREIASGTTPAQISATLEEHGIAVAEIEMLRGWAAPSDTVDPRTKVLFAGGSWQDQLEDVLRMNECLNARHVVCAPGDADRKLLPADEVAANFAHICDHLSQAELLAVIEFLPWSGLDTLEKAAAVVSASGRRNGGVVLDTWHHFRTGGSVSGIRDADPRHIGLIQISDAQAPQGNPFEDTLRRRLFPGDGEFPLTDLFAELAEHGVMAPVSVEMLGDAVDGLPVNEAARRSYQSALDVAGSYLATLPGASDAARHFE